MPPRDADDMVHLVLSPATGVIAAYRNPALAGAHARSMLGVVMQSIKIRTRLPTVVLDDLERDFDDSETPPVAYEDLLPDKVVVDVDDLDGL